MAIYTYICKFYIFYYIVALIKQFQVQSYNINCYHCKIYIMASNISAVFMLKFVMNVFVV